MKGTLHKTGSGWQVWYHAKEDLYYGNTGVRILTLHPDDTIEIGQENLDIKFEIFDNREICNCACHKNPDITHFVACCNNGYKTDNLGHVNYYAKLIDQRPTTMKGGEGWDKILDKAIEDKATRPLTEDDAWKTMKEGDITVNFKPMPEFDEPAYPTRLDQLTEQAWNVIWQEFVKNKNGISSWSLFEHLRDNYNPPTKKQDHDK